MEFLQEITLELNSNTAYTTVGAKQGDHVSRVIKIHITENGEDWKIPAGVSASYRVRKPDGYAIWNDATIPDPNPENVIYVTLTEQTLAAAGRAYADVLFVQGTGDEREVLSTVSFIIIIMASPDIAENVVSSNEFSQILDLTNNANVILNEAEAWAIGTKSGVPVVEDAFSYAIEGSQTFNCDIDENIFREYVGESAGYTRYFTFTCTGVPEGETENHWKVEQGSVTLTDIDLEAYGITITGSPLQSNIIRVVVTDSDIQYQNNAKYYADQAKSSRQAIEDLTVDAHTIDEDNEAYVIKDSASYPTNLSFYLPRGRTGNVNFMTFEIIPETGELQMYRPVEVPDQIQFDICEDIESSDNGKLRVIIDTEVANNG